jgi:hypothetical protein
MAGISEWCIGKNLEGNDRVLSDIGHYLGIFMEMQNKAKKNLGQDSRPRFQQGTSPDVSPQGYNHTNTLGICRFKYAVLIRKTSLLTRCTASHLDYALAFPRDLTVVEGTHPYGDLHRWHVQICKQHTHIQSDTGSMLCSSGSTPPLLHGLAPSLFHSTIYAIVSKQSRIYYSFISTYLLIP